MSGVPRAFGWRRRASRDRAYEADGTLRSRKLPGALLTDPVEAAEHALRLAQSGTVDTLCVHSDTSGAAAIVQGRYGSFSTGREFEFQPFTRA